MKALTKKATGSNAAHIIIKAPGEERFQPSLRFISFPPNPRRYMGVLTPRMLLPEQKNPVLSVSHARAESNPRRSTRERGATERTQPALTCHACRSHFLHPPIRSCVVLPHDPPVIFQPARGRASPPIIIQPSPARASPITFSFLFPPKIFKASGVRAPFIAISFVSFGTKE